MKRLVLVIVFWIACLPAVHAQVNLASPTNVLATSSAPAGSASYTYAVVASNGSLYSVYALSNSLTNGAAFASLSTNPNVLRCTAAAGATSYIWYRVAGSGGQFGRFATSTSCSVFDNGAPGDGTVPWSLTNVGISSSSLQNALWLDGCNISATTPKYTCDGPGLQQAVLDAHGFAGVTGVVMIPQTAQVPGSTLGAIYGDAFTITMPPNVCIIGAGPNASYYQSQHGAVAFDFPAGTVNSCLINMSVELDNADTNGVAISFEGSASAQTAYNKIINFTCYNNPVYGFPSGETCIQINAQSAGHTGGGVWNNLFQNINIQNMTQPIAFSGSSCGSRACNDFADTYDNLVVTGGWGPGGTALNGYFQGDTISASVHDSGGSTGRTAISLLNGSRGNHIKLFCDLGAGDTACITDVAGYNFIDLLNANATPATSGFAITGDVLTDIEWLNASTSFQTQQLILGNPVPVSNLPLASSSPGMIVRVSDSTAIEHEGQACVGSSSSVAIAISNGTSWKCF